jgi:hypothetical protein
MAYSSSPRYAQRQILAKCTPIAGAGAPTINDYFAQISGGEITASVEKVYLGGEPFPTTLCAPSEVGDITLTKHYADDMQAVLKALRPLVGRAYYSISVTDVDCGLAAHQTQRTYSSALLVGMSEPEGDASSGAPVTFALTFAVNGPPE